MARSSVVLPEPEWPNRAVMPWAGRVRSTSRAKPGQFSLKRDSIIAFALPSVSAFWGACPSTAVSAPRSACSITERTRAPCCPSSRSPMRAASAVGGAAKRSRSRLSFLATCRGRATSPSKRWASNPATGCARGSRGTAARSTAPGDLGRGGETGRHPRPGAAPAAEEAGRCGSPTRLGPCEVQISVDPPGTRCLGPDHRHPDRADARSRPPDAWSTSPRPAMQVPVDIRSQGAPRPGL
jgi:hypothetical protein